MLELPAVVTATAPNARSTWKLQPAQRDSAFNGFHRSVLPELLRQQPDTSA